MSSSAARMVRFAGGRGRALDGTRYALPSELPGERTVVILAFRQHHQSDVDRWIELAVELGVPASPLGRAQPMDTAVIEVPLLRRAWLPLRRAIDGGMAAGIADPVVLARTITVYADPMAFLRACGLETPDAGAQVEVMLVGRDGTILWATRGAPGPDARSVLAAALADQASGGGGGGGEFQPGPGSEPEAGPER
jgi:hypothetical protein